MKTILAATDFSDAAHNAAVYAASLARVFSARLVIYNAYQQILSTALETPAIASMPGLREISEGHLSNEAAALDRYSQLIIDTVSNENNPADGIREAARDCKADLIVMGMKGSGKGMRKIMGSTVTGLIRKTNIPVIVVPENVQSGRLDNIAFATDMDAGPDTDLHILDILRELGERFSSKLFLVRVSKDKLHEAFEVLNRPMRISKMVGSLNPVYESIAGKNVTKALSDFIREFKIDMLAMLPHKHSLLERWFIKSTTDSMVFETKVPLLILPETRR